jgi:mono/diheme cytochrome c family protein
MFKATACHVNRTQTATNQFIEEHKVKTPVVMILLCGMTIFATYALSAPADSAAEAGKATYKVSCIYCHGEAGTGNPIVDQFWKIRIPRLNGEYIQKKSDAEITNVILNGKRKMPPAMAGNPENQHSQQRTKIAPDQVPDLIAYIRSLKR